MVDREKKPGKSFFVIFRPSPPPPRHSTTTSTSKTTILLQHAIPYNYYYYYTPPPGHRSPARPATSSTPLTRSQRWKKSERRNERERGVASETGGARTHTHTRTRKASERERAPRGADRLLRDNGTPDGLRLDGRATRLVGGSLRDGAASASHWPPSRRAPRGAAAGKREKNRTGPACVLGFCWGPGAGGAILVIRRDQTADAVWRAEWRTAAAAGGGGFAKGLQRRRRDGSNAAAIFVQTTGELCAARSVGESGNDEISGVTATSGGGGGGGARGNFSNPSDPTGGRTGDGAVNGGREKEERKKKKNKIEETFCVIGKRSKRVFALVSFFNVPHPPVTAVHAHTRTRTWTADAHTHTPRYTSSMGFRFDFFWTPARPLAATDTDAAPPRPAAPSSYTAPSGRSFCLLPARRGAEGHQPCVRASVCVCECTCASDERGAAGRPCSHTGSVDGSSSVLRWSSFSVYARRATAIIYPRISRFYNHRFRASFVFDPYDRLFRCLFCSTTRVCARIRFRPLTVRRRLNRVTFDFAAMSC
ncbi:Uncharacterized protein FWK35_00011838 [Aphis craccivora]|uniref:Uncharacterized protein n=1 Tax=Aphis craccivora TaxID=307492 RepID=A0A6G0Z9W9_APHCR|nr:Uncharacterized protein FWK35_00011838 [Aphis craccivora]